MEKLYTLRRTLSAAVLLMMSAIAWAYDFEVDGIYYEINEDGESVEVTYESFLSGNYSGDIAIPSTVTYNNKTYSVTSIGDEAFRECSSLTSISIPEGVTSIGNYAFTSCSSLTSISIPEGVTSIGNYAFEDCSSLTSISIPESVTSIGEFAFYRCTSLTSISIPEGVTSIRYNAFRECSSLTSIFLPEHVTFIEWGAFSGCSSLTSISIPEGVTGIGGFAFDGCSSLKDAKFASVESMCRISYGSEDSNPCYYADNLYIDGELVTSIEIPESVTSIGHYAFYRCTSLTSISIPESVKSIGSSAFYGCSSLTSITVAANNPVYDSREGCNAIIETASNTLIAGFQSTIIPESVTSIGSSGFDGCSSLTSISIPESVTSIGGYAFYNCSSLTSIICYAEEVPYTYSTNIFYGIPSSAILFVPESAIENYKADSYWNQFGLILAIGAGIELSVGETGLATYCPTVKIDLSEAENIAAYRATVEDNTVTLTRTYKIGVGEGVLLRSLNGGAAMETVKIAQGKIEDEPNDFVGVLTDTWLTETDNEGNTNFVLSRQEDGTVDFYKAEDLTKLAAGKAYLPVPNYNPAEASAKGLRLVFDDDTATGIDIADAKQAEADGAYYTLSGVKVEKPTAKGIYIKNGKKYIIK